VRCGRQPSKLKLGTEPDLACSQLMKATSQINDPAYWRERAEEARRMAEQSGDDAVSRQILRDIAASYDELAELAEARGAS
jgi:hypothetical protein